MTMNTISLMNFRNSKIYYELRKMWLKSYANNKEWYHSSIWK